MIPLRTLVPLACAALVLTCGGARAQTARSSGGGNAQLMQQLQQLASERTALQTENAQMKKELDQLRKERDVLKKAQQGLEQRAQSSAAALASSTTLRSTAEQELKRAQERTQELIAKFRETAQTLRTVESEGAAAKQALATRTQELKVCADHNAALYELNGEVLTRLEHQSSWSRVASTEPFTKIKRVQLENLVDDYKGRAEDERIEPGSPSPQAKTGN